MNLFFIAEGIMLLTLGRKLFWVFVGLIGFVVGAEIAEQYLFLAPSWKLVAVGLVCGLLGALLAVFFQKLAIIGGGFAAGSVIAMQLTVMLGFTPIALITLCGGILGAILLYLVFDWTLIVLSSVAGAALIARATLLSPPIAILLCVALAVVGIVFQFFLLRVEKP